LVQIPSERGGETEAEELRRGTHRTLLRCDRDAIVEKREHNRAEKPSGGIYKDK